MVNKVQLIGNLGQDPEYRTLETGTPVCRLSVATNESWKDKSGEWQKQTEWHNVIVWRELATSIADRLHKGMLIFVEGKISYRKYKDKDGVERYATDITASTVRALEKTGDNDARKFPDAPPARYELGSPADPMVTGDLPQQQTVAAAPPPVDDLPF